MAVKVKIPTALQRLTQGNDEVEGAPGRLSELIQDLDRRFPGIGERISEGEKIRRFVNIYVNEDDIRSLEAEATIVRDGDEVSIVPAIAGGACLCSEVNNYLRLFELIERHAHHVHSEKGGLRITGISGSLDRLQSFRRSEYNAVES